jgi:hypothetical protein
MGCRVSFNEIPNEQPFMSCEIAKKLASAMEEVSPDPEHTVIEKVTIVRERSISSKGFTFSCSEVSHQRARELIECAERCDDRFAFERCALTLTRIMDMVHEYWR